MRLELPQQPSRVVMYAMKKAASKTPHYVISLEQDDLKRVRHERGEKSFLGKLRAGVNNSEYLILDGGANPNDLFEDDEGGPMGGGAAAAEAKAAGGDSYLESKVRREHGCIIYNFKKRENQGVESRKMEVVVPTVSAETGGAREWRSTTKLDDSIFATFNRVRFKVRACAAAAAACLPACRLPACRLPATCPCSPPPLPPVPIPAHLANETRLLALAGRTEHSGEGENQLLQPAGFALRRALFLPHRLQGKAAAAVRAGCLLACRAPSRPMRLTALPLLAVPHPHAVAASAEPCYAEVGEELPNRRVAA